MYICTFNKTTLLSVNYAKMGYISAFFKYNLIYVLMDSNEVFIKEKFLLHRFLDDESCMKLHWVKSYFWRLAKINLSKKIFQLFFIIFLIKGTEKISLILKLNLQVIPILSSTHIVHKNDNRNEHVMKTQHLEKEKIKWFCISFKIALHFRIKPFSFLLSYLFWILFIFFLFSFDFFLSLFYVVF